MMRLLAVLRSVLLFIITSFMMVVLIRSDYWLFLHPKLRFFSLSAAAAIMITAAVSLVLSETRPKRWHFIVFSLFIGMSLIGFTGKAGYEKTEQEQESIATRFTYQDNEYVPLNLGELYLMAKFDEQILRESKFAVRGIVRRQQKFDAKNQILLARIAVTCCLADAAVVVYRVAVPDPEMFTDGQWLLALGSVRKDVLRESEMPEEIIINEIRYFTIEPDYIFAADIVKEANPPEFAYMFSFKTEEPFAF